MDSLLRYCVASGVTPEQRAALESVVDQDCRSRIDRLPNNDQITALIAHTLIRIMVAVQADCHPAELRMVRTCRRCADLEHGKPVLVDRRERSYQVSVSHTANLAMVGYGTGPLGVDAEAVGPYRPWSKLAPEFLHAAERKLFSDDPGADPQLAYRLWVRKEAFLKLIGTGLAFPLAAIDLSSVPTWVTASNERGWVNDLVPRDGYVAAIATAVQPKQLIIQEVSSQDLVNEALTF